MKETKSESWEKEFDNIFQEQFFDLHYRFCPLVDKEGEDRQNTCTKQRNDIINEIKSFIHSQRQKDRDSLVEMVRGMKRDLTCDESECSKPWIHERDRIYNTALADLEQAINQIMK